MTTSDQSEFRPGVFRCAKCGLRVVSQTLDLTSGSASPSGSDYCPNNCGPVWPVNWKSECLTAEAQIEATFDLSRRVYVTSGPHLSGYRVIIGFNTLEDASAAHQSVANGPRGPDHSCAVGSGGNRDSSGDHANGVDAEVMSEDEREPTNAELQVELGKIAYNLTQRSKANSLYAAKERIYQLDDALEAIGRLARSDGGRTFDDTIRDLGLIDDLCRGAPK
jgi:hypothetical protein